MPIEETEVPKDAKPNPEPPKTKRKAAPGSAKLKGQLAELYTMVGAGIVSPFDPLAGYLLGANSEALAESWVDLAETNPAIKRALQKLVEAGGWGGVVMAHGMVLLPVLANRGLLPEPLAQGAAMMTVTTTPDAGQFFTHPRFQPAATPTENGNGNG